MSLAVVERFIRSIFKELHVKRARLMATMVVAALGSNRAGIAALGRSLALQRGKHIKHAIKQIDRGLSNPGFVVERLLGQWAHAVAGGGRGRLLIALDWTDFGRDTHTLVASRVHDDGRVIPMLWRTVTFLQRKGRMAEIQVELLRQLRAALGDRQAVLLADRGFADVKLYRELQELGFFFIIRFRERHLLSPRGQQRQRASRWVAHDGRARRLTDVALGYRTGVRAHVVLVKKRRMKSPWCLATNLTDRAERVIAAYARRFSTEETFRDFKDVRFGWGLKLCRISRSDRRDRMLLVLAIGSLTLTILGSLVERAGISRLLKANTVPARTHSLLQQGRIAYVAHLFRAPPHPLKNIALAMRTINPSALRYAA